MEIEIPVEQRYFTDGPLGGHHQLAIQEPGRKARMVLVWGTSPTPAPWPVRKVFAYYRSNRVTKTGARMFDFVCNYPTR